MQQWPEYARGFAFPAPAPGMSWLPRLDGHFQYCNIVARDNHSPSDPTEVRGQIQGALEAKSSGQTWEWLLLWNVGTRPCTHAGLQTRILRLFLYCSLGPQKVLGLCKHTETSVHRPRQTLQGNSSWRI